MQQSIEGNAEQFKNSFREEAREILIELETALLELNASPEDTELVGRVFRGLHTIKGSGAMFGFENLAGFTHRLETAFDEVRNGRLSVSAQLTDLTLSALDQIKLMIEDENLPVPPAGAGILTAVLALVGPPGSSTAASSVTTATAFSEPSGRARSWNIRFNPGPDLMRHGADPLLLLRELKQLGGLALTPNLAGIPPLEELDPERCYIGWDMVLVTTADRDAIRDVFIFVEDTCELGIEPALETEESSASSSATADAVARALEDKRASSGGRRTYDKPDTVSSLRVPAAKLDQFVDLVGELVTVQARLSELSGRRDDPEVATIAEEIERLTSALRENSMTIRMLPIRATFEKFRRLVHDLARDLGKDVELTMEGADTELDKTVIDQLGDPLMHLIRNSMDHGIESPLVRASRGKQATAHIHLSARHSGASVLIAVADDGGGIDAEAVRSRAVEKGIIASDAELTQAEIYALIFQPGFSTAKQVTDVSGRGVGMDVVRQRVDSLRGTIDVSSAPQAGSTVTLRLPLTLAIIDGLLVSVGQDRFVLPLANTLECIELTEEDIDRSNGKHVVEVRGRLIPYIRLRQHFNVAGCRPVIEQIMVVETEEGQYGFVVDRVLGSCQTVIKNLGRFYRHVQVVSGATILGDGKVALILDPQRLAQDVMRGHAQVTRNRAAPTPARTPVRNRHARESPLPKAIASG